MAPRRVILLASLWGDERSSKNRRARQACLNYLEARGLAVEADPETITTTGHLIAGGKPAFPPLGAGTIAVVPSLEHLADNARDLREGLYALIATGVEVHIAELGGPITAQLPGLMRGLSFAEAAEARLRDAKEAHAESEREWASLFTQFRDDTISAALRKWGIPTGGVSEADFPTFQRAEHKLAKPNVEPEADVDLRPLGQFVKVAREAVAWSQPQLGQALGISASQVSRMESSGKSPHLIDAIGAVCGADEADTFRLLSPAGRVMLAEKRRAELESASAGRSPIWTPEAEAAPAAV